MGSERKEAPAWELHKENVGPSKKGRKISELEQGLAGLGDEAHLNTLKLSVEERLRTYAGDDPLSVYVGAVKEAEAACVSGHSKLVRNIAERGIMSLTREKRWERRFDQDPRFLYLWLKLMDCMRSDKETAFARMKEHEQCTQLAGFWVAWATAAEEAAGTAKAATILNEGLKRGAEPLAKLERAREELEERVAAAALLDQSLDRSVDAEQTRKFFSVLTGVGRHKATPVDRSHAKAELVRLPSSSSKVTGQGTFAVLEEELLMETPKTKPRTKSSSSLPRPASELAENRRDAGVWKGQKLAGSHPSAAALHGRGSVVKTAAAFEIHADEAATTTAVARPMKSEGVLAPRKESVEPSLLTTVLGGGAPESEEKKKKPLEVRHQWDPALIQGVGGMELCFEEARALCPKYRQPLRQAEASTMELDASSVMIQSPPAEEKSEPAAEYPSQASVKLLSPQPPVEESPAPPNPAAQPLPERPNPQAQLPAKSQSSASTEPPTKPILKSALKHGLSEKATAKPAEMASPAAKVARDTFLEPSFTTALRRDVLRCFSDTVELPARSPTPEEETLLVESVPSTPAPPPAQPFQIFQDAPPPAAVEPPPPTPAVNDENAAARRKSSSGSATGGVFLKPLAPAPQRAPLQPTMVPPLVPLIPQEEPAAEVSPPLPAEYEEETLAKFGRILPTGRAASTPNPFGAPPAPVSFSAAKIPETPESLDGGGSLFGGLDELADKAGPLPTITESSRENCRSGTSSAASSTHSKSGPFVTPGQRSRGGLPWTGERRGSEGEEAAKAVKESTTPPAQADSLQHLKNLSLVDERSEHLEVGDTTVVNSTDRESVETGQVDPWASEWQAAVMKEWSSVELEEIPASLPALRVGASVSLGGCSFRILALLGKGAFAYAYKAESSETGVVVLKVQKPGCRWEAVLLSILQSRITPILAPAVMKVERSLLYSDGSVLLDAFAPHGTLLQLASKAKLAAGGRRNEGVGDMVAMWLTLQLLRLFHALHTETGLLHGDVKPDNVLVLDLPGDDVPFARLVSLTAPVQGIRLIDWGRAIDLQTLESLAPASAPRPLLLHGKAATSGFVCREMAEGEGWRVAPDLHGLAGTIYVLLFGTYMNVFADKASGSQKTTGAFKRSWWPQWKELFAQLLNVSPEAPEGPNLGVWAKQLSLYLHNALDLEPERWTEQLAAARACLPDS